MGVRGRARRRRPRLRAALRRLPRRLSDPGRLRSGRGLAEDLQERERGVPPPDCCAIVVIASEVQVSKYGAYTCAGIGTAALAALVPENAGPAKAANATSAATTVRARCIATSFPNSSRITPTRARHRRPNALPPT